MRTEVVYLKESSSNPFDGLMASVNVIRTSTCYFLMLKGDPSLSSAWEVLSIKSCVNPVPDTRSINVKISRKCVLYKASLTQLNLRVYV